MTYLGTSVSIVIAFICYLIAELLKKTKIKRSAIPKLMGFLGIALAFVGYFFVQGFPYRTIQDVLTHGLTSGLASTGFYELGKAFSGEDNNLGNTTNTDGEEVHINGISYKANLVSHRKATTGYYYGADNK